jgi:hypothetical protein
VTAVEHGVPSADRGPATRPVSGHPAAADLTWLRARTVEATLPLLGDGICSRHQLVPAGQLP